MSYGEIRRESHRHILEQRRALEEELRRFFSERGFQEVQTPLLVRSPGMETHIRPMRVMATSPANGESAVFLPTSPEFAMKKLLAQGWERIFQLCPAFRDEPVSPHHLPEFTMLEWYRTGARLDDLMNETELLIRTLSRRAPSSTLTIDGPEPWPRFRVRDLFKKHAGLDLEPTTPASVLHEVAGLTRTRAVDSDEPDDSWDDLFFRIWLNQIEPKLPQDRPCFVYDYPPSQAALAEIERGVDGISWARRFEVFAGGLELANAFQELRDPKLQRQRFETDMRERSRVYGDTFPASPIDETFMDALEKGLPPCSGIALGWNRLVMLLSGARDIRETVWLDPYWPVER